MWIWQPVHTLSQYSPFRNLIGKLERNEAQLAIFIFLKPDNSKRDTVKPRATYKSIMVQFTQNKEAEQNSLQTSFISIGNMWVLRQLRF